jgi:hypothetical protein
MKVEKCYFGERRMLSIALALLFKIKARMAADTNDMAAATAEHFAAFMSFQRQ